MSVEHIQAAVSLERRPILMVLDMLSGRVTQQAQQDPSAVDAGQRTIMQRHFAAAMP